MAARRRSEKQVTKQMDESIRGFLGQLRLKILKTRTAILRYEYHECTVPADGNCALAALLFRAHICRDFRQSLLGWIGLDSDHRVGTFAPREPVHASDRPSLSACRMDHFQLDDVVIQAVRETLSREYEQMAAYLDTLTNQAPILLCDHPASEPPTHWQLATKVLHAFSRLWDEDYCGNVHTGFQPPHKSARSLRERAAWIKYDPSKPENSWNLHNLHQNGWLSTCPDLQVIAFFIQYHAVRNQPVQADTQSRDALALLNLDAEDNKIYFHATDFHLRIARLSTTEFADKQKVINVAQDANILNALNSGHLLTDPTVTLPSMKHTLSTWESPGGFSDLLHHRYVHLIERINKNHFQVILLPGMVAAAEHMA